MDTQSECSGSVLKPRSKNSRNQLSPRGVDIKIHLLRSLSRVGRRFILKTVPPKSFKAASSNIIRSYDRPTAESARETEAMRIIEPFVSSITRSLALSRILSTENLSSSSRCKSQLIVARE